MCQQLQKWFLFRTLQWFQFEEVSELFSQGNEPVNRSLGFLCGKQLPQVIGKPEKMSTSFNEIGKKGHMSEDGV